MPFAVFALATGAFAISTTEFVILGLLLDVSSDFNISIATAGLLISAYAAGVVIGAQHRYLQQSDPVDRPTMINLRECLEIFVKTQPRREQP